MILPLQPPDSHHLSAAAGWLGLGDYLEANGELEKIAPKLRAHPDVLRLRCEIYLRAAKWNEAAVVASALCDMIPGDGYGWIQHSYALHEMRRTAEARDNLLRIVDLFPRDSTIRYNLACYECQLGHLERARQWFHAAMQHGNANELRRAMIDDPDMEPLRDEFKL